jgi:hypothetical protein
MISPLQFSRFETPGTGSGITPPTYRRLRGYSFDPTLSIQLDTALINDALFKVRWEDKHSGQQQEQQTPSPDGYGLKPGPVGEYIEVIDYDPASKVFYTPIDLDDPLVLAQDGLTPSESNPQFHQQMVYAVAMVTIEHFEKALGRPILWSSVFNSSNKKGNQEKGEQFVKRLRIYPHALREANAYYSPDKKALLFGYFPATPATADQHLPGGVVFTCLSHDIIAHETAHAILDGMHRRYIDATHPDSLAFHEAFADIVALFQHFTYTNVLEHQIAKTRGDLKTDNLLGQLAQQFGKAIGSHGALRDAIGQTNEEGLWTLNKPSPADYEKYDEPHDRGGVLVAAIFETFLSIYKKRTADLFRIATGGTGVLPQGAIHPDLVKRLAKEAAKTAQQILYMCIRALDYCPPLEINFGDYLRALVTADYDLVPDDDHNYRIALIESFRRRGIFPSGIKSLSEESLRYEAVEMGEDIKKPVGIITKVLRNFNNNLSYITDRREIFYEIKKMKAELHRRFEIKFESYPFEKLTGIKFIDTMNGEIANQVDFPTFEVHSMQRARRVGPEGITINQVIVTLTQKRTIQSNLIPAAEKPYIFRGGCTLIFDLDTLKLRYVIKKAIDDDERLKDQLAFKDAWAELAFQGKGYVNNNSMTDEPFAFLHKS